MPRVADPIQSPAASKFEASPEAPPPLDCPRRGTHFRPATRGPGTAVRSRALPRAATAARAARRHARPAVVSRQGERNGHLPASAQTCRRVRRLARPRSRRGCKAEITTRPARLAPAAARARWWGPRGAPARLRIGRTSPQSKCGAHGTLQMDSALEAGSDSARRDSEKLHSETFRRLFRAPRKKGNLSAL